jgi:coenzyme F420 hydrogenase subunit beta
VVACPHDVLELHDFDPIQINLDSELDNCVHGETGCSLCAMACPRFHPDIDKIEESVHGQRRDPAQPEGTYIYKVLARAADDNVLGVGQDGGVVSAMIAWGLETGELDGGVVAAPSDEVPWLDEPRVVTTREDSLPRPAVATPTAPPRWRFRRSPR